MPFFLFQRTVWDTDNKAHFIQHHLRPALHRCLGDGQYILGREAPIIIPNESEILRLGLALGSNTYRGYFEGRPPTDDHLKHVSMDAWLLMLATFKAQYRLVADEGEVLELTEGHKVRLVYDSEGRILGWGEYLRAEPEKGLPVRVKVKQGNKDLGTLRRSRKGDPNRDRWVGTLLSPGGGYVLIGPDDPPAYSQILHTHAHIAALDHGELGISADRDGGIIKGLERKMIAKIAVAAVVKANEQVIPAGEPMTLATVCRVTGQDWQQLTLDIVTQALHDAA